jgi:hypothetical protein
MAQTQTSTKNIFVVAASDRHRESLKTLEGDNLQIHSLLEKDDVVHVESLAIKDVLQRARRQLEEFPGEVDAILAHWDFPVTLMVPLLAHERGLRSPSLEAVLKCGHKYWSRKAQHDHIPKFTPRFCLVDPTDSAAADKIDLPYPYWLKPVKGFSSLLGFCIKSKEDLKEALEEINDSLERIAEPFDKLLREADVPEKFLEVGGRHCIAEEYLKGVEIAHEGYVLDGKVTFHGTLDMIRENESFTRLLWPSVHPKEVHARMEDASTRFMKGIGFDNGCFNAEYFWDRETDELKVIEFNPRISQSHTPLNVMVDGRANHQVAIDVALGREPRFAPQSGPCARAGKFLIRTPKDGVTRRVPTDEEMMALRKKYAPLVPDIGLAVGQRLSDQVDQDAYTYLLGAVYLGGESEDEMLDKYWNFLSDIPLEVEGVNLPEDILGARAPK